MASVFNKHVGSFRGCSLFVAFLVKHETDHAVITHDIRSNFLQITTSFSLPMLQPTIPSLLHTSKQPPLLTRPVVPSNHNVDLIGLRICQRIAGLCDQHLAQSLAPSLYMSLTLLHQHLLLPLSHCLSSLNVLILTRGRDGLLSTFTLLALRDLPFNLLDKHLSRSLSIFRALALHQSTDLHVIGLKLQPLVSAQASQTSGHCWGHIAICPFTEYT